MPKEKAYYNGISERHSGPDCTIYIQYIDITWISCYNACAQLGYGNDVACHLIACVNETV
jgi:hypothetical protein